jgi:nucleoporin NDC1
MLAVLQSGVHLYFNYDGITIPSTNTKPELSTEQPQKKEDPISKVRASLPLLAQNIGLRSVCMSIFGPMMYALFVRRTAWSCSLYFATLLWELPASQLSYIPPYHISLIIRSLTSGLLLVTLWESANALFGAYVAQEPLKKEQPFTSHSKDPNGSLLNGLKGKKEVMRVCYTTFAENQALISVRPLRSGSSSLSVNVTTHDAKPYSQTLTVPQAQCGTR